MNVFTLWKETCKWQARGQAAGFNPPNMSRNHCCSVSPKTNSIHSSNTYQNPNMLKSDFQVMWLQKKTLTASVMCLTYCSDLKEHIGLLIMWFGSLHYGETCDKNVHVVIPQAIVSPCRCPYLLHSLREQKRAPPRPRHDNADAG